MAPFLHLGAGVIGLGLLGLAGSRLGRAGPAAAHWLASPLDGIVDWAIGVMTSLGYLGVALLVALENLFPPIPSEVVLPLAGFTAAQGHFSLWGVVVASTAGSVGGALVLYALGRAIGEPRLRELIERHGRWFLLSGADLDRSLEWFDRHGERAVFFGRLVPTVRSIISVPAGLAGMPAPKFMLYTTLGSSLWNTTLIGLGSLLGEHWEAVSSYLGALGTAVAVLLAAGVAWFVVSRWRGRSAGDTG